MAETRVLRLRKLWLWRKKWENHLQNIRKPNVGQSQHLRIHLAYILFRPWSWCTVEDKRQWWKIYSYRMSKRYLYALDPFVDPPNRATRSKNIVCRRHKNLSSNKVFIFRLHICLLFKFSKHTYNTISYSNCIAPPMYSKCLKIFLDLFYIKISLTNKELIKLFTIKLAPIAKHHEDHIFFYSLCIFKGPRLAYVFLWIIARCCLPIYKYVAQHALPLYLKHSDHQAVLTSCDEYHSDSPLLLA